MIYILDGMSEAGKTSYAKSTGLPIKKKVLNSFEEVVSELNNNDNVAYDRFLNVYYISDEEAQKINTYLLNRTDCVCKMFICDLEKGWQRVVSSGKGITREKYENTYYACKHIKDYLTVYEVVNIDEI